MKNHIVKRIFVPFTLGLILLLPMGASPVRAQEPSSCQDQEGQGLVISKGLEFEDYDKIKSALNHINKEIPVGDQPDKTWRVYTKPILSRKNLYLAKTQEGELVGYAAMKDEGNYLSWIAIKKDFRGKEKGNIAKKLMHRVLEDYPTITLDVRSSNGRAIKFYEKLEDTIHLKKEEGHDYKNGEGGWVFTLGPKKKPVM